MRLVIFTIGSRGDVQPYLALAVGLRQAGFQVTLATHEPFRDFVTDHGVTFAPLPGDPRAILRTPEARRLQGTGRSMVRFARRFTGLLQPWFDELIAAVTPLHVGADLVLYSPLAFPSWHLSQVDGTPTCLVSLQPLAPTSHFPPITLGGANLGRVGNLTAHHLARLVFWLPLRGMVNRWRREALSLPPLPLHGPWGTLARQQEPELYGFSPTVVPPPPDWPPRIHVTGYWFLPERPAGLDSRVENFLSAGDPPLYVGFGSTDPADAAELAEVAVVAARRNRLRLVLGAGWAELEPPDGDDVLVVGETDHRLLFPRTAAVTHHGGAGTTASGLRAGVPNLVVPFYADQPFWGARVAAIGAGPSPIPRERLTSSRLAAAVAHALTPALQEGARRVGEQIRGEDGVEQAVEVVRRLARQ